MIVLPNPSDGNCLFAALASFFQTPQKIDHEIMRRMIVHYINQHPEQFETDIRAEGYESVDHYCENMARKNFWGDGIVCQCFAIMFSVNIWICYSNNAEDQITQISHYDNRPHLALLLKGEHYERIISW